MDFEERAGDLGDDYDGPWKAGLDGFLPQMMELLFPAAHAEIDWSQPIVSLNAELPSLMPAEPAAEGRIADALYQVMRHGGGEHLLVIHVEVQSSPDHDLARRMFVYLCRCFEKYGVPVFGFAVLGDLQTGYRPGPFGWRLGEGVLHYRFERAKLLDFRRQEAELESNANPFALVVLAHLYTKTTRNDPERRRSFKLKLIRLLLRRNYQRPQVEKLFQVIDWMVRLDSEQGIIFKDEVRNLVAEGNDMSTYVSTFELTTRFEMLQAQLIHRFGELPAWAAAKLKGASNEMLQRWSLQLLDAGRLEEVFV